MGSVEGKWVWLLKGSMRAPCAIGTVLYLGYGGGYRKDSGDNI